MPPKKAKAKGRPPKAQKKKDEPEQPLTKQQEAMKLVEQLIKGILAISNPDGTPIVEEEDTFQSCLDVYYWFHIRKYFQTTDRGRILSEDQFDNMNIEFFSNQQNWIQPGYHCTDFMLRPNGTRQSIRMLAQVRADSEHVHELIYEHGVVCIHAATLPSNFIRDTEISYLQATLWLVSIQDPNTKTTVWPATWIHHDDFDGLVRHATTATSEYWRNNSPWSLNIVPNFVMNAPKPLICVVGVVRCKENVPFNFWLQCQLLKSTDKDEWTSTLLSRIDLVEAFSFCHAQIRTKKFAFMKTHDVVWKEFKFHFPKVQTPYVERMMNPFYWKHFVLLEETPEAEGEPQERDGSEETDDDLEKARDDYIKAHPREAETVKKGWEKCKRLREQESVRPSDIQEFYDFNKPEPPPKSPDWGEDDHHDSPPSPPPGAKPKAKGTANIRKKNT